MKQFLFYISALFILNSCSKDILETNETISNNSLNFRDGRLTFNSIKEFQDFYYSKQEIGADEIFKILQPYYDKGFLSLRPPMTDLTIDIVAQQLNLRLSKLPYLRNGDSNFDEDHLADLLDELEELISCDVFGALLNEVGEIVVGDKILKYTDVGLFVVDEIKHDDLLLYLDLKGISQDPLVRTNETQRVQYFNENTILDESLISVSSDIQYFRSISNPAGYTLSNDYDNQSEIPSDIHDDIYYGGGGSSGGSNNYVAGVGLESFVENLQPCNTNGGFLGSIFGINKICIDQFENRRRVRTKVWRHNYLYVYTLGTKVKNQRKDCQNLLFGSICWWYKTSHGASEIVKYDEAVQFEYDLTQIYSQHFLNQWTNNLNQNQVFYNRFNVLYEVNTNIYATPFGNNIYTFINSQTYPISNYPRLFRDDLIIEAFGNNNIVDFAFNSLNSQLAANNLNKLFWKEVWNTAKSQLASLRNEYNHEMPRKITLMSQHPQFGKIYIHKGDFRHRLNSSNIERIFDYGLQLGITINHENKVKLNWPGSHQFFPKNVRFKVTGAAKVNGVWRGSKIVHNF